MKPYFAILIDSFWEAVTSKVLWALLIGWSVLLGGLAPFGYITESSYQLTRGDVRNRLGLAQKLAKGLTPQGSPTQKAISNRLGEGLKKQLESANSKIDRDEHLERIGAREIVSELNKMLKDKQLYDPRVFESAGNRERLKAIVKKSIEERSAEEVEILNRELLHIVYSADLFAPRSEQLWIGYAGLKLGNALPFQRREANILVERIALEIIIRFGLSFVTVFVGLIITSPMIPETFRSGSLHLLLSKPVSRPLVYLTKFFGGTLFVLVNIAYLLTGLYLLVGWRLGIWNSGLLLCIPLLLFVFVIFYSVSALVGLIWNNPIICVVVCIVFWVFCLVIGVLESSLRIPAILIPQIARFEEVDDELLAITQAGAVNVWNEKYQVWQPAADIDQATSGRVLGPIHDKTRQRLVMRSDYLDGMGQFSTRSRNFVFADLKSPEQAGALTPTEDNAPARPEESNAGGAQAQSAGPTEGKVAAPEEEPVDSTVPKDAEEARRKPRWPSETGIEPPMLMLDLLTFNDRTLAITRNGIFEIDWAAQDIVEAAKSTGGFFGNVSTWLGGLQPQPFKELSPADYAFGDSVRVAKSADQTRLFIYNGDRVDSLQLDDKSGKFIVQHSYKLEGEDRQSALLAVSDKFCVIAREDGPLTILSHDLSEVIGTVALPRDVDARQLQAIADTDRFSVVTHSGEWYILEANGRSLTRVNCPWQGLVTGVTLLANDRAWVGIKPNRAALFDLSTSSAQRTLVPAMSRLDFFYNWIARPLYLVSPKPSSLNGVLQTLLSRDKAGQTQLLNNDLAAARVEVEVWQPIISNLIFVCVLLSIGCVYVWRREF